MTDRVAASQGFIPRTAEFSGRFTVHAPIEPAFALFSPLGERSWVPGWNPELLHPPDSSWDVGQIFRTREDRGDAVWIVSALDREAHRVEYYRVEANRYVARVHVQCTTAGERGTEVSTSYAFVGLSAEGNSDIAALTGEAYAEKMRRWTQWIGEYFARSG